MSTMAGLSEDEFLDRLDAAMKASRDKDTAKYEEIIRTIPLTPDVVRQRKSYMSKEEIIDLGFDMSFVETELGKDWYEAL